MGVFFFSLLLLFFSSSFAASPASQDRSPSLSFKGVDLLHPILDVSPMRLPPGQLSDSKDAVYCDRITVSGHPRLELGSYANSFRVAVAPSAAIPEYLHRKIVVCFHRNASLGLCHCEKDEWKTLQKGLWTSVMSPYDTRYVDVKFIGDISGFVTVSVEEDSQIWRLVCLAAGLTLFLLAPVVSSWVPFYYSTSMAIGVFLVIIILLYQGMRLLPTGRKSFLCLSTYVSVVGAGSFVLHRISALVNSVLVNFGLSEELHNPVFVFVVAGIVLSGAALGCWFVSKFVISKDGRVDVAVAHFVKWAMRTIATTFILQSTLDTPLAMVALAFSSVISFLILKCSRAVCRSDSRCDNSQVLTIAQVKANHKRAEFLSRSEKKSPGGKIWSSPNSLSAWSNSPVKGLVSPSSHPSIMDQQDYYSTFHKTSRRRKFTKKQWEDFTRASTQQAVAEWLASPEVANWMIEKAGRFQVLSDYSSEGSVGSESDSTVETVAGSSKRFGLFSW
ncbi:hypothetical protein Tsubulata_037074 [Turnera subulata]|uniref:Uncharacterized protein n=1 Tax=Turnera subulata TaxID=218843 RepID=A0A9Q0JFC8_9ROSI|nr:hypothetical protein Tsubulata_037074 [Turnera subulata]